MCSLKDAFHKMAGNKDDEAWIVPGPEGVEALLRDSNIEHTAEQIRDAYTRNDWCDDHAFTWKELRELAEQLGLVDCDDSSPIAADQDRKQADPDAEAVATPASPARTKNKLQDIEFSSIGIKEMEDADLGIGVNHMWQLVRQEDHSRLQSDINEKFKVHRGSYANLLQHSEEQIRSDWMKNSFYQVLFAWLCDDMLGSRSFRHHFNDGQFVPLVSSTSLNVSEVQEAAKTMSRLGRMIQRLLGDKNYEHEFLKTFDGLLWKKWDTLEEIARYYSKSEKVSFFADGVLSEYYNIMNQVLDQLEQINPNAMVAPNVGDVDEAEIDRRTSMLREMTPSMLSEARALMLVKWQDKLNKLPISSRGRFSSEPPHSFLVSEYYLTVEEIVAQSRQADTFAGNSSALPDSLPTVTAMEEASMSSQVNPSQARQATIGMQDFMTDTAYDFSQQNSMAEARMEQVCTSMLLGSTPFNGRVTIEARVAHFDPQPRDVTPRSPSVAPVKRTRFAEPDANIACDILLVDNTGPAMLTLWGKIVNEFYTKIAQEKHPIVFIEGLRVAELPANSQWHGTSLTTIRMLHSVNPISNRAGTTLSLLDRPRSSFLLNAAYNPPMPPACIHEFSDLVGRCKAPFRVTLRGLITDLSEMQATVSESDKRLFTLIDEAGSWIKCCAVGMPARSVSLANGNEVVLYFCTGRASIGTSVGMLYLMKDSVVVKVGFKTEVPVKRLQIEVTQT